MKLIRLILFAPLLIIWRIAAGIALIYYAVREV